MACGPPRLFADCRGVWRETRPGLPIGIQWGDIFRVGGYKQDYVSRVDTIIELDFEYGEWIELNDAWEGFDNVIADMTAHLHLDPDWFDQVAALSKDDDPVTIWQRTGI